VSIWGTTNSMRLIGRLIVNAIVGLILLFVTNLFLSDDVPINLLTVVICAIGGVVGWLLVVILHLLGIAF
jgi:pro-sigmaK processing inhibitor BofA